MKISIVTAVYNNLATVCDALDSVSSQKVMDTEHIIIDGGSCDGTLELLHERFHDCKTIVSEPDNGMYDAMNKGVAMASGVVVGILNSDDFYANDHVLEKVTEVFRDESVDACYGDLKYIDADDLNRVVRYWKSGEYKENKFYWGWMPPHPTFFVRKSVYECFGGFNLDLGSAADYEFMLRVLLKHRINAVYIPEVLVHMRTGGISNASLTNRLTANRMDRKAWAVNGLKPYPWTILMKPVRKLLQWVVKS